MRLETLSRMADLEAEQARRHKTLNDLVEEVSTTPETSVNSKANLIQNTPQERRQDLKKRLKQKEADRKAAEESEKEKATLQEEKLKQRIQVEKVKIDQQKAALVAGREKGLAVFGELCDSYATGEKDDAGFQGEVLVTLTELLPGCHFEIAVVSKARDTMRLTPCISMLTMFAADRDVRITGTPLWS